MNLSKRRLAILALLTLFAVAVLFASVCSFGFQSVLLDNVQDSGHVVVFAIVAIVTFAIGRSWGLQGIANYCQAGAVSLVCGIGIEVIQYPLPNRDASLGDIGRDSLGIVSGLLVAAGLVSFRQAALRSWTWRAPLIFGGFCLLSYGVFPVVDCVLAKVRRNASVPIVMSTDHFWWKRFVSKHEADWWLAETPADWPNDPDGLGCYVLFYTNDTYPGINVRELWPDWSHATHLSFEVYSFMKDPVDLVVRVNDWVHYKRGDHYADRYNGVHSIQPGFQRITIPIAEIRDAPKTREMDMSNIGGLFFFLLNSESEVRLMLDNVQLETR
ncbi:MAG: VanZ family protein [Planctomycetales bacterium]|nr:VanZ family protein [Planctomycetales bacterium]